MPLVGTLWDLSSTSLAAHPIGGQTFIIMPTSSSPGCPPHRGPGHSSLCPQHSSISPAAHPIGGRTFIIMPSSSSPGCPPHRGPGHSSICLQHSTRSSCPPHRGLDHLLINRPLLHHPPVGQTGYINISPGTAPPICCSGRTLGLRHHPNILLTYAIVSALVSADLFAPMPASRCR